MKNAKHRPAKPVFQIDEFMRMNIYYRVGLKSQALNDVSLSEALTKDASDPRHFCEKGPSATGENLGSAQSPLVWSITTHLPTTLETSIEQAPNATSSSTSMSREALDEARRKYRPRYTSNDPLRSLSSSKPITFHDLMRLHPDRAWRRLKLHEKDALVTRAMITDENKTSIAFTQNLSHAWIEKLIAAGKNAVKTHSDELNRRMRIVFAGTMPMEFHFDTDEDGRLHVHGVINVPVVDEDAVSKLLAVLRKAGGYDEYHQTHLDLHSGVKWRSYCQKDIDRTAAVLGTTKLSYRSQAFTQMAESAHEADLALRNEAKVVARSDQPIDDSGESPALLRVRNVAPAANSVQRPSMPVSAEKELEDLLSASGRELTSLEYDVLAALDDTD